MRGSIVLCLALSCAACGDEEESPKPRHPALSGLSPPPVNAPLQPPRGQAAQQPRASLPPGEHPAELALRDDVPVTGTVQLEGTADLSPGSIVVTPDQGSPLELLYRLPKNMLSPSLVPERVTATISEKGGPHGADRLFVLMGDGQLTYATAWRSAGEPVVVTLTGSVRLEQRQAERATAGGYSLARLFVMDGDREAAEVPIGEPTRVKTTAGSLAVYAQMSHRHFVAEERSDAGDQYILRAWVTGQK